MVDVDYRDKENIKSLYRTDIVYGSIRTNKFFVTKRTKCGVWIADYTRPRFVNLRAKKQYASETKEHALTCFIARKRNYLRILECRVVELKKALNFAEEGISCEGRSVEPSDFF